MCIYGSYLNINRIHGDAAMDFFILALKDIILHNHFLSFISPQLTFCLKITLAALKLFLTLSKEGINLIMLIKVLH